MKILPLSSGVQKELQRKRLFEKFNKQKALFEFARAHGDSLKKIFLTHGEPKASLALVQRLRDYLGLNTVAPKYGESFEI